MQPRRRNDAEIQIFVPIDLRKGGLLLHAEMFALVPVMADLTQKNDISDFGLKVNWVASIFLPVNLVNLPVVVVKVENLRMSYYLEMRIAHNCPSTFDTWLRMIKHMASSTQKTQQEEPAVKLHSSWQRLPKIKAP